MKRLLLVMMLLPMLLVAGCGSEISVVIPIPIPITISPSITYNQYTQDTVNSYVDGAVDFYAPDHDLDTITITVFDSRGVLVTNTVSSLGAYAGQSTGTISYSIDYLNYRPDNYTFSIYVTDRWGYISNSVYGSFWV